MDDDVTVFRASTGGLRDRSDIDSFREHFGRTILRIEMTPLHGQALACDMTIRAMPDLALATGALSPMSNRHPEALAADDDLVLVALQSGSAELRSGERTASITAGEAVLTSGAEAGTFTGHTATRLTNIRLRRELLAARIADPHATLAQPIPASYFALRLLLGYSEVLTDTTVIMDPAARRVATDNVYDLAALVLRGAPDEGIPAGGARAARLFAIKVDVRRSLAQHDLSITEIARRHGISGSYARRLFAEDGTSFSEYVLQQRLSLVHRLLGDPCLSHRQISGIAFDAGFGDLSYFNRAFRRRYGMTPKDVRTSSRGDGTTPLRR